MFRKNGFDNDDFWLPNKEIITSIYRSALFDRLAYQPPASSTFLSEQISHQQPAISTFLSEQTSTSH
jgi:hypothetical protein